MLHAKSEEAYHGIDFLMTWNSTHIANAELRPRLWPRCGVWA